MDEMPPEPRVLNQVPITTSVHNWLRIADILEEHADQELRDGTSEMKAGYEFGRQMAHQIRDGLAEEGW